MDVESRVVSCSYPVLLEFHHIIELNVHSLICCLCVSSTQDVCVMQKVIQPNDIFEKEAPNWLFICGNISGGVNVFTNKFKGNHLRRSSTAGGGEPLKSPRTSPPLPTDFPPCRFLIPAGYPFPPAQLKDQNSYTGPSLFSLSPRFLHRYIFLFYIRWSVGCAPATGTLRKLL